MNKKISAFHVFVEAIIRLQLYKLHDYIFKGLKRRITFSLTLILKVRTLDIPKLLRKAKGYLISQNF